MNIIEWFKNLFGKKGPQYNLLVIKAKERPAFVQKGENYSLSIQGRNVIFENLEKFPFGTDFEPLETEHILSDVIETTPDGILWFIKTIATGKSVKLGKGYAYYHEVEVIEEEEETKDKNQNNDKKGKKDKKDKKDKKEKKANGPKTRLKCKYVFKPELIADFAEWEKAQKESLKEDESSETKVDNTPTEVPLQDDSIQIDDEAPVEATGAGKTTLDTAETPSEVKEEETPAEPKAEDTVAPKVEEEPTSANIDEIKKLIADELQKLVDKNVKINMANSIEKMLELLAERISNLRDNADNYKREAEQNEKAFKTVENERAALQDAYDELKKEKKKIEREKGGLQNDLEKAKRDADTNEKKLKEGFEAEKKELNSEKDILNSEKDGLQKELDELRKTDAGQLKAELDATKTELETTKAGRDAALKDAETKQVTIDSKQKEIDNLKTEKNDLNNQLNNAKAQAKQFESELNTAKSTIDKKVKEVSELTAKNNELSGKLEKANGDLKDTTEKLNIANHQITSLNSTIGARDITIGKLNGDVAKLTDEKKALNVTLDSDIESQTANYSSAAKALVDAVAGDFLSECDPDAETDTVQSMCGKIRRGVQNFADAVEALGKKEFKSTTELTKAYEELVAENIKGHAFTEIARWWAYSRLPFVADRDREEGRTVSMKAINAAYAALSRILALADYRYQIPALFVENLNEGDYQDMTGREQLNLDYQFPNVRTHAESIDRGDRANTVLDIVELGYYKGADLVKKTSVII